MKKRLLWFSALFLVGLVDILVYRGFHLYYRAKDRTADLDKRLAILERGRRPLALNDLLLHEAGKAYFESGVGRLQKTESRDADFARSRKRFLQTLALNPFSPTAHFDFAQVLQYLKALDLPAEEDFLDEYKKAARLSGTDNRVFGDVGKIMMARWGELSEEDRRFMLSIGRKVLEYSDLETLASYLEGWNLNVRDYSVLSALLPDRADVLRPAARFLAERSLDRQARLNLLVQAEALDYAAARQHLQAGQNDFQDQRLTEAANHFREARTLLESLRFYQGLTPKSTIDALEYRSVLRSVLLGTAKCRILETHRLEEASADLEQYLILEDRLGAVGELETFLRERGLIESTTTAAIHDFARYAFDLDLSFRQSRYRDVVKAGQGLERSVISVPEEVRRGYARVLEIVGDAYQKLDFLYESNAMYEKALIMGADELLVRLKMRKNYERLSDPKGLKAIDQALGRILSPPDLLTSVRVFEGGVPWISNLTLDAKPYFLIIELEVDSSDPPPYLAIEANGRILWDDYVTGPAVQVNLTAIAGPNSLQILPLNGALKVQKASLLPAGDAIAKPGYPGVVKKKTSD